MIVKANVARDIDGKRVYDWFLVKFGHSRPKSFNGKHRRSGYCSIYYLTDLDDPIGDGEYFTSRICGEKQKLFITEAECVCSKEDNYVKAFSRIVTLQKALRNILAMQAEHRFNLGFTMDDITFNSFMKTLYEQHPQGIEDAKKLFKKEYFNSEKKVKV